MSTTAGTMSTSSFLPKYIRTYVYKHGDLEWQQVHQSHLELPSQFGWVVKMKRDPGVFMTWSVPDVTSSTRATWAHWHCSSAAPLHHLHLFIYPEADFSSIQLGESLRTSGSQQCWLGPDQSIESILNQNLLCLFFFFLNAIKIKNWLLEKWHELKSLHLHRPHSSHSCPIPPSPDPPSMKLIYRFTSRSLSLCLSSLVSFLWRTLHLFHSFSLFYLIPLRTCCCIGV